MWKAMKEANRTAKMQNNKRDLTECQGRCHEESSIYADLMDEKPAMRRAWGTRLQVEERSCAKTWS